MDKSQIPMVFSIIAGTTTLAIASKRNAVVTNNTTGKSGSVYNKKIW